MELNRFILIKNKEKVYLDKMNCCGCTACYSVCSRNAIKMEMDKEGFLYPEINYSKCILCGMCYSVCPLNN